MDSYINSEHFFQEAMSVGKIVLKIEKVLEESEFRFLLLLSKEDYLEEMAGLRNGGRMSLLEKYFVFSHEGQM